MKILVTGCAGFIGFHFVQKLIKKNYYVVGIDSLNNYYERNLKVQRLKILKKNKNNFLFYKFNLKNRNLLEKVFKKLGFMFSNNDIQAVINCTPNGIFFFIDSH